MADPQDPTDDRSIADGEHDRDEAPDEDAANDTEARYGEDESPA